METHNISLKNDKNWSLLFNWFICILQLTSVLTCRQHISRFIIEWEMDPHICPYVIRFGFYVVYRIGCITLDWDWLLVLLRNDVLRHTFHLSVGEMTIRSQDVVILGIHIHMPLIIGTCDLNWLLLCCEILGVTPLASEIRRSTILTRWLSHQFSHPPIYSNDAHIRMTCMSFHTSITWFNIIYRQEGYTCSWVIFYYLET